MTETPKRGRKACAPEHLRRGRNLRASDEEWSKIQAAAERAGKGVTTWARETLVEAAEAT
jgi:predicted HicB family RNase H-like nuclease